MQKIAACILLVALIFSLSGCSKARTIPDAQLPAEFESGFDAEYKNLKLSGYISRLESGICTVTFTAPESLNGITFTYIGGKITASYEGIDVEADISKAAADGFISLVAQTLDVATKSGNITLTSADGYNRYTLSDGSYVMQEHNSGSITSLVIDDAQLSINFSEFIRQ